MASKPRRAPARAQPKPNSVNTFKLFGGHKPQPRRAPSRPNPKPGARPKPRPGPQRGPQRTPVRAPTHVPSGDRKTIHHTSRWTWVPRAIARRLPFVGAFVPTPLADGTAKGWMLDDRFNTPRAPKAVPGTDVPAVVSPPSSDPRPRNQGVKPLPSPQGDVAFEIAPNVPAMPGYVIPDEWVQPVAPSPIVRPGARPITEVEPRPGTRHHRQPGRSRATDRDPVLAIDVLPLPNGGTKVRLRPKTETKRMRRLRKRDSKHTSWVVQLVDSVIDKTYGTYTEAMDMAEAIGWAIYDQNGNPAMTSMGLSEAFHGLADGTTTLDPIQAVKNVAIMQVTDRLIGELSKRTQQQLNEAGWDKAVGIEAMLGMRSHQAGSYSQWDQTEEDDD